LLLQSGGAGKSGDDLSFISTDCFSGGSKLDNLFYIIISLNNPSVPITDIGEFALFNLNL